MAHEELSRLLFLPNFPYPSSNSLSSIFKMHSNSIHLCSSLWLWSTPTTTIVCCWGNWGSLWINPQLPLCILTASSPQSNLNDLSNQIKSFLNLKSSMISHLRKPGSSQPARWCIVWPCSFSASLALLCFAQLTTLTLDLLNPRAFVLAFLLLGARLSDS